MDDGGLCETEVADERLPALLAVRYSSGYMTQNAMPIWVDSTLPPKRLEKSRSVRA